MSNITLLEISARPYLRILSEKYSRPITKLTDIPEAVFDEWKQMGFEWIWMMGIWELGEYGRKHDLADAKRKSSYDKLLPGWTQDDVIGSPFAIVSYTINPELGKEEDILWLRHQLNQRNMKLMLDFVPNHTAFDSIEIKKEHKRDFYIHFPDNVDISEANLTEEQFKKMYGSENIAFGCHSWTDAAQLNYMNEEMRQSRIQILLKIASQADGIRCDVADLILNKKIWEIWHFELEKCGYPHLKDEFWEQAITAVKSKYKNCVFLAEANYDSDDSLKNCGFDYIYDRLTFKDIEKTKSADLSVIQKVINDPKIACYAHMIENHDEKRSLIICSNDHLMEHSAAVMCLTLPGLRFFNQDQWCGYKGEIGVQLRRAIPEKPNEEFIAFYTKLLNVLKLDILKNGKYSVNKNDCFSSPSNILSWRYELDGNYVAIFVNFSKDPINVTYNFNHVNKSVNEVSDLFNNNSAVKLDKTNELSLHLQQYNYLCIKF